MATIKKQYIAAFIAGLALTATLAACSTPATSVDPDAKPSTSEAPAAVEEAPAQNDLIKPFGETVTYDDGVSISVEALAEFTMTEYASPTGGNEMPMIFKIVLTNNSEDSLVPAAMPQATSDGVMATYISDVGNPEYGDIGLAPTATILPGQSVEWYAAFGVLNRSDVTLTISPAAIDYDSATFTTMK